MRDLFAGAFAGLPVLVTGHTGFKGSWLTAWLCELGAQVIGLSLPEPPTTPSNFVVARLGERIIDVRGDIRDLAALRQVVQSHQPALIFHLAAQPIVLHSIRKPELTFDTNAGGTVNVLEVIRNAPSVRALVCITTDKVYHNEEWAWGYRENDRLGGRDPYSASKAMAELAIHSYRDTFFPAARYAQHGVAVASVRAGNVIGGGDFADFRLVPDCMRALLAAEPIAIRNPLSVRPWQLALEPLAGYLWLAARLLKDGPAYAEAWNFGPLETQGVPAGAIAAKLVELWGSGSWIASEPAAAKHETHFLRLSWEKAAARLGWRPVYSWQEALADVVAWHKSFQRWQQNPAGVDMYEVGKQQIAHYAARAKELGLPWAG